ncbi:MAG: hypothetical protein GC161_18350 [Planctomycetaceae bacterium]|nr:hypothetical protein [Planctomycetaceae bacterium]
MSYTQDDIEALEKALASGAREVQFRDRKVVYRNTQEMNQQLRVMRAAVTGKLNPRRRLGTFQSGIHVGKPKSPGVTAPSVGIGPAEGADGGTFGDDAGGGNGADGGAFGS